MRNKDANRPVIPALSLPALPVAGGGVFPVGRVICIGRNYASHAREMGDDGRQPPFWFTKSLPAVAVAGGDSPREVAYPPHTTELHHEVELVVALGGGGHGLAPNQTLGRVYGYAVGLDLTRRDLQRDAKRQGRPWSEAKDFDGAAPVGVIHPASVIGHPREGRIQLEVNGEVRQRGDLSELIWPVSDLLARLSASLTLRPGDLIFTGTPAGVSAVEPGDVLVGTVEGVPSAVRVRIGE
ncbi:MAG: fumarylpyruvate hydrolase [Myxococcota bacterium]|jgi:fumarylpyruvate hydrolase